MSEGMRSVEAVPSGEVGLAVVSDLLVSSRKMRSAMGMRELRYRLLGFLR